MVEACKEMKHHKEKRTRNTRQGGEPNKEALID